MLTPGISPGEPATMIHRGQILEIGPQKLLYVSHWWFCVCPGNNGHAAATCQGCFAQTSRLVMGTSFTDGVLRSGDQDWSQQDVPTCPAHHVMADLRPKRASLTSSLPPAPGVGVLLERKHVYLCNPDGEGLSSCARLSRLLWCSSFSCYPCSASLPWNKAHHECDLFLSQESL